MIQLIREKKKREKATAAATVTVVELMIADCFCITGEIEGEQITRYKTVTNMLDARLISFHLMPHILYFQWKDEMKRKKNEVVS